MKQSISKEINEAKSEYMNMSSLSYRFYAVPVCFSTKSNGINYVSARQETPVRPIRTELTQPTGHSLHLLAPANEYSVGEGPFPHGNSVPSPIQ